MSNVDTMLEFWQGHKIAATLQAECASTRFDAERFYIRLRHIQRRIDHYIIRSAFEDSPYWSKIRFEQ